MGEVGQWGGELFVRYQAARGGPDERGLLGELARANEALIAKLATELRHDRRCGGNHLLGRRELLSVCRIGFVRAMPKLDLAKCGSKPTTFLKWLMVDEIQRAVQETSVVMRGRRRRAPDVEYLENDEDVAAEEAEPVTGLREALEGFLVGHCRFVAAARVAACEVRARYESVVVGRIAATASSGAKRRYESLLMAREQAAPRGDLVRALLERGAQRVMVRVPWERAPVRGFAGVRLQDSESVRAMQIAEREAAT